MPRLLIMLATAVSVGFSSGCATVRTSDNAHVGSPKIYGGTRLNIAALSSDDAALTRFEQYGIEPPSYPVLDLPLSLVGDTLMLPFSAWYTLTEPVVGRE